MARPKKDNAEYHTHDKDMRNDLKIKALRKKFGHEGYSVFNMMLEVLTDSDHFQHEWNEMSIELLSADFDTDRLEEIINYCATKLSLFTIENGHICSFQHQKRFKPLLTKRKRDIEPVIASDNPHSIGKYSKVENSKDLLQSNSPTDSNTQKVVTLSPNAGASGQQAPKVTREKGKKKNRELPDTVQTVKNYFSEKMNLRWPGEKISFESTDFWDFYCANGWVQGKEQKPIVSWKHAANRWINNCVEGVYNNHSKPKNTPHISQQSQPKPPEPIPLSDNEKESLNREFIQDCFTDFCAGKVMVGEFFGGLYNQLQKDNLLVLSEVDKERIKDAVNGDVRKSKNTAVAEYFTRIKKEGKKQVYAEAKEIV